MSNQSCEAYSVCPLGHVYIDSEGFDGTVQTIGVIPQVFILKSFLKKHIFYTLTLIMYIY